MKLKRMATAMCLGPWLPFFEFLLLRSTVYVRCSGFILSTKSPRLSTMFKDFTMVNSNKTVIIHG